MNQNMFAALNEDDEVQATTNEQSEPSYDHASVPHSKHHEVIPSKEVETRFFHKSLLETVDENGEKSARPVTEIWRLQQEFPDCDIKVKSANRYFPNATLFLKAPNPARLSEVLEACKEVMGNESYTRSQTEESSIPKPKVFSKNLDNAQSARLKGPYFKTLKKLQADFPDCKINLGDTRMGDRGKKGEHIRKLTITCKDAEIAEQAFKACKKVWENKSSEVFTQKSKEQRKKNFERKVRETQGLAKIVANAAALAVAAAVQGSKSMKPRFTGKRISARQRKMAMLRSKKEQEGNKKQYQMAANH